MSDTPTALLTRVRERLSDPSRWTQRSYARDADGHPVSTHSARATCWCLHGAIKVEADTVTGYPVREAVRTALWKANGQVPIETINDSGEHVHVLLAIDRALAWLEGRE